MVSLMAGSATPLTHFGETRECLPKARPAKHKLNWLRLINGGNACSCLNPLPLVLVRHPLALRVAIKPYLW
jgi:hypothetical protein